MQERSPPATRTADELSALLAEIAGPLSDAPPPSTCRLRIGQRVGRFELVRKLGRGGFGVVFEAIDTELGRRVAFKVVQPSRRDAAGDELLLREAKAVARLQHPAIVTLHDAGRSEAGPFLVLELLHGETLAARLARGRLSSREAVRVSLAVAEALAHAHAGGVLHRDLTPANVFLTSDGGVKVLDFGLATVFGREAPRASGTPGYMAPEQRRGGREDTRTDLFALGTILAEMLTSPSARAAPSPDGAPAIDVSRVPTAVREIVARLVDPDPERRPRDAREALAALRRVAEHLDTISRRPATASPRALDALRQLFAAEECARRPLFGQDCADGYRRAVELDPTLAVAHYQLAMWRRRFGGTVAEQRDAIALALKHRARAPPLERLLIHALAAQLDGRADAATAFLREAAERFPEDARAPYEMGDLLRHEDELELSVPWFERTLSLEPGHGWALGQLAEVLGILGRTAELRDWLERWERVPSPVHLHAASIARGWLGDVAGAADAARRGIALGAGLVAQMDLLGAMVMGGRYAEAQATFGALVDAGSPVRRMGFYTWAALDAYQGKRHAGLEALDRLVRDVPGADRDAHCRSIRADYLLGDADPVAVRSEIEILRSIDPRSAAEHAVGLAWLGDIDAAAPLAALLRPGSPLSRAHEALVAWHAGETERALALLSAVAAEAPLSVWRIAPLWLLGDLAARAGRDDVAIAALERFEALYEPRMMWRSWAHGRALLVLARCHARRGNATAALAALRRLVSERADTAEPDDVTLADALRLEEDLIAAQRSRS
jgi:tetratricopeptide (TPR) repeat protein